jgi:hypothetical protein
MQDISERGNIPAKMNEGRLQEKFDICRPHIARFDLASDRINVLLRLLDAD